MSERSQRIAAWLEKIEGDWSITADRSLKVAAILDPFSAESFRPECDLLELSIDRWEAELEDFQPDLLLVESAWVGKDEGWTGAVGHLTADVRGVIDWATTNDVPKAFWNKEDPVKFQSFLNVAKHFDAVFTTDLDCVPRYREILGHDRAYYLPFAAQPATHNPIRKYQRKQAFCFAGAYYANYPERTRTLERFMDVLPSYAPVDIYDRNFGRTEEQFRFPDRYAPLIRGKLPFEQIDKAYKGYRYAVNLNTVQQSQSMFARRVFELTACATTTVSNFSRGMRNLFGDYVVNSDEPQQLLMRLSGDEQEDRKIGLGAMRQTMASHCYQDRLAYVAAMTAGVEPVDLRPRILVIGHARTPLDLERLVASIDQQRYERATYVIVHKADADAATTAFEERVDLNFIPAAQARKHSIEELNTDHRWVAFLHPDDAHGASYLSDFALALRYADTDAVTRKRGHARRRLFDGKPRFVEGRSDRSYTTTKTAPLRASLVRRERLGSVSIGELAATSGKQKFRGRCFSIDRFDYCRNARKWGDEVVVELPAKISSEIDIRAGRDLEELRAVSEDVMTRARGAGSIDLFASIRSSLSDKTPPEDVIVSDEGSSLRIQSSLSDVQHRYLYSDAVFPVEAITKDRELLLLTVCDDPSAKIHQVIFYLDANHRKIGQHLRRVSRTVHVRVPDDCAFLQYHYRVSGKLDVRLLDIDLPLLTDDEGNTANSGSHKVALDELFEEFANSLFERPAPDKVSMSRDEDGLRIETSLDEGEYRYLYSGLNLPVDELAVDGKLAVHALCDDPMLNIQQVLFFLDADRKRIGHEMGRVSRMLVTDLPDDCAYVQFHLRVAGPIDARLTDIVLPFSIWSLSATDLHRELVPSKTGDVSLALGEEGLEISSVMPDGRHEYLFSNTARPIALLPRGEEGLATIFFETSVGMNLMGTVFFLDEDGKRLGFTMAPQNVNHSFEIPEGTAAFSVAIRVGAGGEAAIKSISFEERAADAVNVVASSDVLLLTNFYPSYDNLYRNGFVHSRARAYAEAGRRVEVFTLTKGIETSFREFENVDVVAGNTDILRAALASGQYKRVLVHFLDAAMWSVLKDFIDDIPVTVWVHGSEVQPWWRRTFNYTDEQELEKAKAVSDDRMHFWRDVTEDMHPNLKFVFVSQYFADEVAEDIGREFPDGQVEIIHNPIDDDIFDYQPKDPDQRLKLLSIRPYATAKYANDLTVEAILALREKPYFDDLQIRLIGDGALFDETLAPVRDLPNVEIERRFLTQPEIAQLHKEFGVFLTPTRMDAQGVSRDEAMASGLVAVTNAVTAIPEFVDEDCGILAPADDADAMARGLDNLVCNPDRFMAMSRNAAARVRSQSAKKKVVARELQLIEEASSL